MNEVRVVVLVHKRTKNKAKVSSEPTLIGEGGPASAENGSFFTFPAGVTIAHDQKGTLYLQLEHRQLGNPSGLTLHKLNKWR
jgi:hypothetical protein